jgi:8-oxo-dGTP pyrophosphatase MutT (NUDIX family)
LAVAQGFPFPAAASTFACVPPSPIWRPSARLIVLDPDDRTLLFSCTGDDGATRWFTPGGGLRRGEALTAAAVRELAEETGFRVTESGLGPVVATRGGLWRSREEDRLFFGADSFFCVRVPHAEVSTDGHEALEASLITGYRWWTLDELAEDIGTVSPPGLPALVAAFLRDGPPTSPLRLPWRD